MFQIIKCKCLYFNKLHCWKIQDRWNIWIHIQWHSAILLWHVLFWLHTPVFSEHSVVCTIVLKMKIKQLINFLTFSVLLLAHVTALCELHKILPCWWRASLAELGMQIVLCASWERYSLWAVVSFRRTKHRLHFSLDLRTYLVNPVCNEWTKKMACSRHAFPCYKLKEQNC